MGDARRRGIREERQEQAATRKNEIEIEKTKEERIKATAKFLKSYFSHLGVGLSAQEHLNERQ
jgi:hypothetical protein